MSTPNPASATSFSQSSFWPTTPMPNPKITTLYLLVISIIYPVLDQSGAFFSEAISMCRPFSPCWTCEVTWIPNAWNPSVYTLCINGRAYHGQCQEKTVFSYRLKCCVVSQEKEWRGCATRGSFSVAPPVTRPPEIIPKYTGECGIQISPLIIPAHPSLPGSWPWQANIEWKNDFDIYIHLCGGTLINDQWIVTASHCVFSLDKKHLRVILGAYNLSHPTSSEITVGVSEYFVHPQYVRSRHPANDVALIKMKEKVDLSWQIQPICLPILDRPESTDYSDCWITGWGETLGTGNPNILNELKVTITDLKSCNISWNGLISTSQICVGNGLTGACAGDSGGPLVCRREGHFVLVGITSWGIGQCYSYGFPNIFTRLYSFLPWIQHILNIHGLGYN